jgi:DNA-binding transcriptional LysR family regulator
MAPKIDRIEDLEIFARIVETGSLTAAGASLDLSTAVVSRRLAMLEQLLGVRLLDRTSRRLMLTDRGREFYARTEALLQQVHDMESALQAEVGELRGSLRISVPTLAAEPDTLRDFVALFHRHPHLNVEVLLSDRPVDVVASGLDAALYLTDAPDRHPGDVIVGHHPTALCAAPSYLLGRDAPEVPDDLLQHRTVRAVSKLGRATSWPLIHQDGTAYEAPPAGPMFLSDDFRVLSAAIHSGAGIGRMPVGYIARGKVAGELELVLPKWRFRPIQVAATLRRRGAMSAKVALLIELTRLVLERADALVTSEALDAEDRDHLLRTWERAE